MLTLRHPFMTIDREIFLGRPVITSNANAADLQPSLLKSLESAPSEPFLAGYTARFCDHGATVFDGDQVVASYHFGDTLVVLKPYRRRGIATELVYQWRIRYPGPSKATARTKASQAVQTKVWARIVRERPGVLQRALQGHTPQKADVATNALVDDPLALLQGHAICGADGLPLTFYHATSPGVDSLDPVMTPDGGVHFGNIEQATMRRASFERKLIAAHLFARNPQRTKDTGSGWKAKIARAKSAGKDALVYLNRYEGMTTEVIESLAAQKLLERLDSMSDAEFLRRVPAARDSVIVFDANQIYPIQVPAEGQTIQVGQAEEMTSIPSMRPSGPK